MSKHFPAQTERLPAPDDRLVAALPTGRETVPIHRARRHLAASLIEGTDCVVCGQHAQLYRRKIHATMARQLVRVYKQVGTQPFHAPTELDTHGGDFAKLAHWGLIAERAGRRQDGGRVGWWRITKDGEAFVQGRARVPEYVLIYAGEKIGFDGDAVGLLTILGDTFDLRDVVAPAVPAGAEDRAPVDLDVVVPDPPGTPDPHPATADEPVRVHLDTLAADEAADPPPPITPSPHGPVTP